MIPPHDPSRKMSDTDEVIAYFLSLPCKAIVGIGAVAQLLCLLILGLLVIAMVMFIILTIIAIITACVQLLYDAVISHNIGSRDFGNSISESGSQGPVQADGPHIIEEEAKQSFDEDARTIVGEGNGNDPFDLNGEANFKKRNTLLKDDRLQIIEEAEESFDEDACTTVGQETGKGSLDLNEKANSEERNPLLKDDGQHLIDKDEGYIEEDGRKSFGEGNERTSVDLNEKDYPEQR